MGSKANVDIEWISDLERIGALEPHWRKLESRVSDNTPVSSFDYAEAWYRHYSGTGSERYGRPMLGAAWHGGELVGLAPWTLWRGTLSKVPVRRVDFTGFNAQGGEFLMPDARAELAGRFLESACAKERFDVICLNGFRPESIRLGAFEEAAMSLGLTVDTAPYRYAVVDLEGGFEAYRRSMSRNFRRSMKRIAAKVEALGTPRIERFGPGAGVEGLPPLLERIFAIADESWKVKVTGPMAKHHRDFYRETITRYAKQGKIDLSILTIDRRDAAFLVAVVEGNICFDLTISFVDEFKTVSPGIYLMFRLLESLPESGIEKLISYGDHEYKERWASGFVSRTRLWLFRGPRARLARFITFRLRPHLRWIR